MQRRVRPWGRAFLLCSLRHGESAIPFLLGDYHRRELKKLTLEEWEYLIGWLFRDVGLKSKIYPFVKAYRFWFSENFMINRFWTYLLPFSVNFVPLNENLANSLPHATKIYLLSWFTAIEVTLPFPVTYAHLNTPFENKHTYPLYVPIKYYLYASSYKHK